MKTKRKPASALLAAVHDTAAGLHESGLIDLRRLRQYDALCLAPVPEFSAAQIRALRARNNLSQTVFAAVLGGRRTILGGALGAIFLIAAGELLRPLGDLATFIVSAVALAVVLVFPGGLIGLLSGRAEA